ncbi:hypothetical protein jhhlp_000326 [Lomentospora prolificans]|uniref:F-box domain-containing protein n=1 Tax=Lomentospora prolificans TaxID=41688 RepID=A0A2N3NKL0_9PEZI|nr:hypothetical protein jhhlp_000326 [Lomentospora prolificans]
MATMCQESEVRCAICRSPIRLIPLVLIRPTNPQEVAEEGGIDGFKYSSSATIVDGVYDPRIVTRRSIEWIRTTRIVGYSSVLGHYISSEGLYIGDTFGNWTDGDNNIPHVDRNPPCYRTTGRSVTKRVCYPFHSSCYHLFLKCATGSFTGEIDPKPLYEAFSLAVSAWHPVDLNLPYRNNGLDSIYDPDISRFWTKLGAEQLVCDPLSSAEVKVYLKNVLQQAKFRRVLPNDPEIRISKLREFKHGITRLYRRHGGYLGLGPRPSNDVFSNLPYEVILNISEHLTLREAWSLIRASPWLSQHMRHSVEFWDAAIARHLPWFFEIHDLIKAGHACLQEVDLYAVIVWALEVSWGGVKRSGAGQAPRSLWERPHAILSNRRRIWHVCEKIHRLYLRRSRSSIITKGTRLSSPGPSWN